MIKLLTRPEAAEYIRNCGLPVTETILSNKASRGNGPRYKIYQGHGIGRGGRGRFAVYKPEDLDAWIESQLVDPKIGIKPADQPANQPTKTDQNSRRPNTSQDCKPPVASSPTTSEP